MHKLGSDLRIPSMRVYIAALSALMGPLGMGAMFGWSAPAFADMSRIDSVPQIKDGDYQIKSWIGSCVTLGALLGALIAGPSSQYLGRRKSLIICGIPSTIGWLLICFANSVTLIIVGRVITGACSGLVSLIVPTYLIEISTPKIRGSLGSAFLVFLVIGILLVYVFGSFLSWNLLATVALIPSVLMTILMIFMPESPIWLYSKDGRNGGAKHSLRLLRHTTSDIDGEMNELNEQINSKSASASTSLRQMIRRSDVYKPLFLAIGLMFFQQISGVNVIRFYATDIFRDSGSSMKPIVATILLGIATVVSSLVACLLIDRLGRRILLIISGFGHSISLGIFGFYYFKIQSSDHLIETTTMMYNISTTIPTNPIANSYGWVPVVCLIIFNVSFAIGFGPITWMMVPEMTGIESRSLISTIATVVNWSMAFITTKEYSDIEKIATKHGALWIFTGFSILSILFTVILLPETKGKTFEEIRMNFLGINSNNIKRNKFSF